LKDAIPNDTHCNNVSRSLILLPFLSDDGVQNMDLVPPYPHACLYQLDLFVNDAFLRAVDDTNVILGVDTDFDWMMHTALMHIGNDGFNG
jgi:hypothetical protein